MSKILVIDDERAIRRALREILEFEEFEVIGQKDFGPGRGLIWGKLKQI